MSKFVTTEPLTIFQRNLQAAKAARQPVSVTKSASDLAWDAVVDAARYLISKGAATTVPDAVEALKAARSPVYLAWDQAFTERHGQTTTVVKTAVPTAVTKRQALLAEVNKRAAALVHTGKARSHEDGVRQTLNSDRALYKEYQKYGSGPVGDPSVHAIVMPQMPTGPVYEKVRGMAAELRADDLYGRFAGLDETAMMQEVFKLYPSLWSAYRAEVSGAGEDTPPKGKR